MKDFQTILCELKGIKRAVLVVSDFNPITFSERRLITFLHDVTEEKNMVPFVFITHNTGSTSYSDIEDEIHIAFPRIFATVINIADIRNYSDAIKYLITNGFNSITLVVPENEVRDIQKEMNVSFRMYNVIVKEFEVIGVNVDTNPVALKEEEIQRIFMPQIRDYEDFIDYMSSKGISSSLGRIDINNISSNQREINWDKVSDIMKNPSDDPIIISSDWKIIDGNHRYFALKELGASTINAVVVDEIFDDLLILTKAYV